MIVGSSSTIQISKSLEQRIARELRKSFFYDWDKQFFIIFGFTLIIEIVFVFFLSRQPIPEYSENEIVRIQERYANIFLEGTVAPKEDISSSSEPFEVVSAEGVEGSGVSGGGAETGSETGGGSRGGGESGSSEGTGTGVGGGSFGTSMSAVEARRQSREAISREVSNKGLLGLLTSSGSAVEGEAVSSLFGGESGGGYGEGTGVGEDLDRVLASVGGIKTQGTPGLGGGGGGSGEGGGGGGGQIRGGRSGETTTIYDLVSDLGSVSSQSLSRKGEIQVETPTEVVGGGTKSVYRSPEAMYEVMYSHVSAITYCYERELKKIPDLKGKISVRITISPNGSVKNADIVSSTLNNESVERCILTRIRLWDDFQSIDASEGDVTFRQSYVFGY